MPRTYYPIGHPKHKVQTNRHAKLKLTDGTINPLYKPRTGKRRSGKSLTKFNRAFFVGIDGEGVLPDGYIATKEDEATPQNYVLMCNSEGEEIFNEQGINTVEALDTLG